MLSGEERWGVGVRELLSPPTQPQNESYSSLSCSPQLNELSRDADLEDLLWNDAGTEVMD